MFLLKNHVLESLISWHQHSLAHRKDIWLVSNQLQKSKSSRDKIRMGFTSHDNFTCLHFFGIHLRGVWDELSTLHCWRSDDDRKSCWHYFLLQLFARLRFPFSISSSLFKHLHSMDANRVANVQCIRTIHWTLVSEEKNYCFCVILYHGCYTRAHVGDFIGNLYHRIRL